MFVHTGMQYYLFTFTPLSWNLGFQLTHIPSVTHFLTYYYLLHMQFPSCTDAEAISVACLDLHYSVTIHQNVLCRKEKQEETYTPIALRDLDDDSDSVNDTQMPVNKSRLKLYILYAVSLYCIIYYCSRYREPTQKWICKCIQLLEISLKSICVHFGLRKINNF